MSDKWTFVPCISCGRPIKWKLDTRKKPPVPVKGLPLCKSSIEFDVEVESLSQEQIETRCQRDTEFADKYARWKCVQGRNRRLDEARQSYRKEFRPCEAPSEQVERFGRQITVVEGPKGVKAVQTEQVEADHSAAKVLVAKQDHLNRPTGLKSESFPIVPIIRDNCVVLPKDENDRQIRLERSGHEIVASLRNRPELRPAESCPHKNDPATCKIWPCCGITPVVVTVPAPSTPVQPTTEELLRNVKKWVPKKAPVIPIKTVKRPRAYREVLGVERETILNWFDECIFQEYKSIAEPKYKRQATLANEIKELQKQIAHEHETIGQQSRRYQKLNWPEVRPRSVREKIKRESRLKIEKLNEQIATLQHRLDNWTTDIEKLDDGEIVLASRWVDLKLRDTLRYPAQIRLYSDFVSLVGPKPDQDSLGMSLEDWENTIILVAIRYRLLTPDRDRLKYCHGLRSDILRTHRNEEGEFENKLFLKSDCGLSIYGNGFDGWQRRGLSGDRAFDRAIEFGSRSSRQFEGNPFHGEMDSGDLSERQHDE